MRDDKPCMLDAALQYAAKGWHVFPLHTIRGGKCGCGAGACDSPGKHPMVSGGVYAATTDEDQIRVWWARWPEANIGVATGMVSRFIVLDVDVKGGGDEALADYLKDKATPLPQTQVAITGSGGKHILFKHPGVKVPNKVRIAPGLDIRGDGGYIAAPPSLHISGQRYRWQEDIGD
jgi:putative DNA primase/helicase